MKYQIPKGTTSYIQQVFILDSSSTTGAGLTGLTNATAGLDAHFMRDTDATPTVISLAAGTIGTYSSGGFIEIDAVKLPGWYQLGIPDAALAAGAENVGIHLKGAANMAPLPMEIQLTASIKELAAIPGKDAPFEDKINLLFMWLRNLQLTTSTSQKVHKDDGTVLGTAVLSDDDVTFSQGKFA